MRNKADRIAFELGKLYLPYSLIAIPDAYSCIVRFSSFFLPKTGLRRKTPTYLP